VKQVNQREYKDMIRLGLIDFSQSSRNIAITNKQKKSKARTYYVEDEVVDGYYRFIFNKNTSKGT
jgi:hypothetical protein